MRVGVAWYAEAEWERVREVVADPETLESCYAEWLKVAREGLRELARAGIVAEQVPVRVGELEAWCQQQGRPLDASARSAFAAELLRRRHEGSGRGRGA
jgi:hypothetical protein